MVGSSPTNRTIHTCTIGAVSTATSRPTAFILRSRSRWYCSTTSRRRMCLESAPTWGSWRSERERPLLDLLDESAPVRPRAGLIFAATSLPTAARSAIWRARGGGGGGAGGGGARREGGTKQVCMVVAVAGAGTRA